jgi:hypothetical protein
VNIGDGQMLHLLMLFTDRRDEEIRAFDWTSKTATDPSEG